MLDVNDSVVDIRDDATANKSSASVSPDLCEFIDFFTIWLRFECSRMCSTFDCNNVSATFTYYRCSCQVLHFVIFFQYFLISEIFHCQSAITLLTSTVEAMSWATKYHEYWAEQRHRSIDKILAKISSAITVAVPVAHSVVWGVNSTRTSVRKMKC